MDNTHRHCICPSQGRTARQSKYGTEPGHFPARALIPSSWQLGQAAGAHRRQGRGAFPDQAAVADAERLELGSQNAGALIQRASRNVTAQATHWRRGSFAQDGPESVALIVGKAEGRGRSVPGG
jgi:hypothetical protein